MIHFVMVSAIIDQLNELRAREEPFVLATVVAYKSPQSARPGSKAIIKNDGSQIGWVGGGCVQPIVLREAKQVLQTGQPKLLTINPDAARDDWKGVESYPMTCEGGGSLEIYLEPFLPKPQLLIVGRSPVARTVAHLGALLDFFLKSLVCFLQLLCAFGHALLEGEQIFGFLFSQAFFHTLLLINVFNHTDEIIRPAIQVTYQ